jgi:hypothetical protein
MRSRRDRCGASKGRKGRPSEIGVDARRWIMGFDVGRCREDGAGDEKLMADKRIGVCKAPREGGGSSVKRPRKAAPKPPVNGCLSTTTDSWSWSGEGEAGGGGR